MSWETVYIFLLDKSMYFAFLVDIKPYQVHFIKISGLGLEGCIEHVWKDTVVYIDNKNPISIGRSYGRVSRHLLHEELLRRYNCWWYLLYHYYFWINFLVVNTLFPFVDFVIHINFP